MSIFWRWKCRLRHEPYSAYITFSTQRGGCSITSPVEMDISWWFGAVGTVTVSLNIYFRRTGLASFWNLMRLSWRCWTVTQNSQCISPTACLSSPITNRVPILPVDMHSAIPTCTKCATVSPQTCRQMTPQHLVQQAWILTPLSVQQYFWRSLRLSCFGSLWTSIPSFVPSATSISALTSTPLFHFDCKCHSAFGFLSVFISTFFFNLQFFLLCAISLLYFFQSFPLLFIFDCSIYLSVKEVICIVINETSRVLFASMGNDFVIPTSIS